MSFDINPQGCEVQKLNAVIGIDIGGTKTLIIIRSLSGEILYEQSIPSNRDCLVLKSLIDNAIDECGLNSSEIKGLAMGIPGRIDPKKQLVIDAPGLSWKNLSLADELFRFYDFPCRVENDGTMALIAETVSGKAKDTDNCIIIVIGTGLGGAIMVNGRIIAGVHHSAGEIGYCIFEDNVKDKIQNRTGNFGFLESRISGTALESRISGMTPQELFATYLSKSGDNSEIVDAFIYRLSVTIANLVSILDPGTVIIGGGVSKSLEPFIGAIRENVAKLTPIEAQIEISGYFNRAGAIGACIRAEME